MKRDTVLGIIGIIISIGIPLISEVLRMRSIATYKEFKESNIRLLIPLLKQVEAMHQSAIHNGSIEEWHKFELAINRLDAYLANTTSYEYLHQIITSEIITDNSDLLELEELYTLYKRRQVSISTLNEIVNLSLSIERKFNNQCKECYNDSKEIETDVLRLVKLRNKLGNELGYENYHTMSLILNKQDPEEIFNFIDLVQLQTKSIYHKIKKEIDQSLSQHYNISKSNLKINHYHFFDWDGYYEGKSVKEIAIGFIESIGFDIDIKDSHTYSNNEEGMKAILYDIGYSIYTKYIPSTLPYLLRKPSHPLVAESIAMLFQRQILHFPKQRNKTVNRIYVFNKLAYSRWIIALYNFERSLYYNPEQDLNKLWLTTIEHYLLIKTYNTSWVAVKDFVMNPCYVHNHLFSQILASQLNHYISTQVLKDKELYVNYYGRKEVGEYLKEVIFCVGKLLNLDELIVNATSKVLTPEFYMNEINLALTLLRS